MKKRFAGHVIVSDLDGTFFGENGTLVQRNLDAIAAFQKEGGLFTIATGRNYGMVAELIPQVAKLVNAPIIACNGAVLYDVKKEKLLHEKKMTVTDDFFDIIEDIKSYSPDLHAWSHVTKQEAQKTDGGPCVGMTQRDRSGTHSLEDVPLDRTQNECYKIVFCLETPAQFTALPALRKRLEETLGDRYEYCQSWSAYLEVLPKGGSKGDTLKVLRDLMQAQMPDTPITVYGVGDYENDFTLLQAADVAVCPENASQGIKEISNYQLCHHTEGVIADLIEVIAATVSK